MIESDVDGQLIISYGINDCKGAVFALLMRKDQKMLIFVERGQEVLDFMEIVMRD